MKRFRKIFARTLTTVLVLLLLLYGCLHIPAVQSRLTSWLASYLSQALGAKVEVGGVDIDFWTRLVLTDVLVEDQHRDTLLFVPDLRLGAYNLNTRKRYIDLSTVELNRPVIHLKYYEGESGMNYAFITDYLASADTTQTSSAYQISISQLKVNDARFSYDNFRKGPRERYGIDWNRLHTDSVNLRVSNFFSSGDSVFARVNYLSAREAGGFKLNELSGELTVVPGKSSLQQASILTPLSSIRGNLSFEFDSLDDFDDFENRVVMRHEFEETILSLDDLAWFASDFKGINRTVELSGRFRGKVSNLKGKNIYIKWDEHSWLRGNVAFAGLPDIRQTFMELEVEELTTNKAELEKITLPPFDSIPLVTLHTPSNFALLGQLTYKGNFTGFYNNFTSYGELNTSLGRVKCDISLKDTLNDQFTYKGRIRPIDFHIGRFYGQPELDQLTADLYVQGMGLSAATLNLNASGRIQQVVFHRYAYRDIEVKGNYRNKYFKGHLAINDPSASLVFDGSLDFTKPKPELNFVADVSNLDFKTTNLFPEARYSAISMLVKVKSEGLELESFNGTVDISQLSYCSEVKEYHVQSVHYESTYDIDGLRLMKLTSPMADATLRGQFSFEALAPSFMNVLGQIIPSFKPAIADHSPQRYDLSLRVHDLSYACELFLPDLNVASGTRLNMSMDEIGKDFKINLYSDSLKYIGYEARDMVFDARRPADNFFFNLNAQSLHLEGFELGDFSLGAYTTGDTVMTDVAWGNNSTLHGGNLSSKILVRGNKNLDVRINRHSTLQFDKQVWRFSREALVEIDSSQVAVSSMDLRNGHQFVRMDGLLSEVPSQRLNVMLSAFDLEQLNFLLADSDLKLNGTLSGVASVTDFYTDRIFSSDLVLVNLALNNSFIGDLCVESAWDHSARQLHIEGDLEREGITPLKFGGHYLPDNKEQSVDVTVYARNFDLAFINGFLSEGSIRLSGTVTGDLSLRGTPNWPELSGMLIPADVAVYIPYLNTTYYLRSKVEIAPDAIVFPRALVYDEEDHQAYLTGAIIHENFGKWNFDLNVEAEREKFLCINTSETDNSLFFGKAYGTGYISAFGYADKLEFDVNLKTRSGSTFSLPLGNTQEVTFENFIHFVDSATVTGNQELLDLTGVRLDMNLEITPDVDFQIIFDKAVGDVMSGRGKGHLNLAINPYGDFTMHGLIEVVKGNYLFTLKNLVNKEFVIRPGGTLAWYGDPFQADMSLATVYKLSAALYDLMPAEGSRYKQRVPVDLVLNLSGKLFNPGIDFTIELPTVDELTRSMVQSIISTEQEKNKQAFALLVLRRFVSPPNVTRQHTGDLGFSEHGSELLTSQLNNWLSQLSDEFNLGFNYRPGDEISNQEIALALSTQLFNERLLLSGNLGVSRGNTANQNPSNLIGDIRIEYKLTEEGKIRLVVYNNSNEFNLVTTNQGIYTQGVGVLYQEEFDSFDQFMCAFGNLFRRGGRKSPC